MSFLLKKYDKLIAFVVLAGVILSAVCFAMNLKSRTAAAATFTDNINNLKPAHPVAQAFDIGPYDETMNQLRRPRRLALPAKDTSGFFIPDIRVWCPRCTKAIPENSTVCPACLSPLGDQVIPPETKIYGDNIPITYEWVMKHNLNPTDASDAEKDFDNDGFTNLEEFLAGTNPRDAKSFPPIESKLLLKNIVSKPVGLVLTGASLMPGNTYKCQVNDSVRTYFIVPTEDDAKRGSGDKDLLTKHGYKATHFEKRSEKRETPTGLRDVDTSILTILRVADGTKIQLVQDVVANEDIATLEMPLDKQTFDVAKGATFTLRGTEFLVIEIDSRQQTVVIENKTTGNPLTVKR